MGVKKFTGQGKKLNAVYLVDHELGIKVFADAAFYSVGGEDPKKPEVVPFLLKHDAEAYASKNDGKLATYAEALSADRRQPIVDQPEREQPCSSRARMQTSKRSRWWTPHGRISGGTVDSPLRRKASRRRRVQAASRSYAARA